jgi:hypothetical protein
MVRRIDKAFGIILQNQKLGMDTERNGDDVAL